MQLLPFPYFTVQKEILIKGDSTSIKDVCLMVVAYHNSNKALNENCMYITEGKGRTRVDFTPMHRYILGDGRPSLNPWEMHRSCKVKITCGYIVLKLYKMRDPFQSTSGFIFNFECEDVQEELALPKATSARQVADIIAAKIKADLPRVSNPKEITNPSPFKRWPETAEECETEEDRKKFELVQITKHEFETLSKLVTPFPVIEGKKGVQGDVLVLQRGGILPTNIQGSIPDRHIQLWFPEFMFDMTKAFSMPPETEESDPIPNKKKDPEGYRAYMLGGALVRGSKTERHPLAGRAIAPFVKEHETHWDILKAHAGKNLDLKKIKGGNLSILVHWPAQFLQGEYSWDGCQVGPTEGYETKVFKFRRVPMSVAHELGPVIPNKILVRKERQNKKAGIVDDTCILYATIEEHMFGFTSMVHVCLAPDETQLGILYDVLPDSTLKSKKTKQHFGMVPPVAVSIVSAENRMQGCTFYLVDNDPRDIKVVSAPPKEGEPVKKAKKPAVVKPKIDVKRDLKTFLGYGVQRGIRVVSPTFIRDIPCSIPDGMFDIKCITDVVDSRHFNQLAAVAIGQKRSFNEDIKAFVAQEDDDKEELSEREKFLACPILNLKVNYMSKNLEVKERAAVEWQRMDRKNKAVKAYEKFKEDKQVAEEPAIFPRTRYVTTKKDTKKRRAKKEKQPIFESEGLTRPRNFLQYTAWRYSKHVRFGMQCFTYDTPAAFTVYRRLRLPNPMPFAERAAHAREWFKEDNNIYSRRPVDR
jgi:hypothetical protein